MKFNEIKKLIGVFATASVLTACGATSDQVTVTENNTAEAVANEALAEKSKEVEAETKEEITVFYEQSATGEDKLEITNGVQADYTVKDYVAPEFFPYMTNLGYEYTYNEEDGGLYLGERLISGNVEVNEDGTLNVRDYMLEEAIPVVKYVRTGENDNEVEARYIALAPIESNLVSGITFVMEKNDAGNYEMTGMLGVFGEDITKLPVYEGTFDGWSVEVGGEVVFETNDQIKIGGDMVLYPHFIDNEAGKSANEDGTCVEGQIEEIDGKLVLRIIHVHKYDKDGNVVSDYALAGLDTEKDNVTGIDKEKVKEQQRDDVEEAEKKKAEEAEKKKQEEAKKKQEESKKTDNGGSNKPSGNSGQSQNNVNNQDPYSDWVSEWGSCFVDSGAENDVECYSGLTGE
jgi:hypothetical protein